MGKVMKWGAGAVLVMIVAGLLVLVVINYFRANAPVEVNQASNPQKTQPNNLTVDKEHTSKLVQLDKETKLEMEWMRKHQMEVKINEIEKQEEEKQVTEESKTATKPEQKNTNAEKKTVYLTFDDGPKVFSKDIIAILEQYQMKATFFMLEGNIKRFPDAVNLMVNTGHAIGIHGVTHDSSKFYASAASVLSELDETRHTIKAITGLDIYLMRTPYGSKPGMTEAYKQVVFDEGYLMWDWTIDSEDWYYKDARLVTSVIEQIKERMEQNEPLVILLHEKRETLEQLPSLLDFLSKHHFECKPIDSSMEPIHF
jgi:peptidoglycan-N-acetylglucosamine deacetylase